MMTDIDKERLRSIPTKICSVCHTKRRYTNPVSRCSKCKELFCYDHIMGNIEKKGVKNYCQRCADTHLGVSF